MHRYDPTYLECKWRLTNEWEISGRYTTSNGGRSKSKRLGQVVDVSYSSKGKVNGKTDIPILVIQTSQQDSGDPSFAFQVTLLNYDGLSPALQSKMTSRGKELVGLNLARAYFALFSTRTRNVISDCVCVVLRKSEFCFQSVAQRQGDYGRRCRGSGQR